MGKNKLKHLQELLSFPNVIQKDNGFKGKWNELAFKNNNPITLELGCGKGEYTVQMGDGSAERNFIGIDIKGPRIYTGAKLALEKKLANVLFLRMLIDHLPDYFEKDEVSEIWITFPDPYPPKSKAKQRLTSPKFNEIYAKVLKKGGAINLKTDDDGLYQYTLETINDTKLKLLYNSDDIYGTGLFDEKLAIKTYYEKKHLIDGKKIKYVKYCLEL